MDALGHLAKFLKARDVSIHILQNEHEPMHQAASNSFKTLQFQKHLRRKSSSVALPCVLLKLLTCKNGCFQR